MMMDDAKKKAATIVIGIGGKPEEGEDINEMHVEAAQELVDAVKDGDAEGVAYALKMFYMLCEESSEEEY